MRFAGFVSGPCSEGIEPAIEFAVLRGEGHARLLFPRYGEFPSLSPFVRYEIVAIKRVGGALWSLEKILRAEPIGPVTLGALITALSRFARGEKDRIVATLRHELRAVPSELTRVDDIPERDAAARALVADAFQPPEFYGLLRYFPSAFLRPLSLEEMRAVAALFAAHPMTFAYWRSASRQMVAAGVDPSKLRVDDRALCRKDRALYDDRCPALHLRIARVLGAARAEEFSCALSAENAFFRGGHLAYPCEEDLAARMYPHYAYVDGRLADPATLRDQIALKDALAEVESLRLVRCRGFGPELAARIAALGPGWRVQASRPGIETAISKMLRNSGDDLVVLHAHKIGPRDLARRLKALRPRHLILVGDDNEIPAHYAAGGGDPFREACDREGADEWPCKSVDSAAAEIKKRARAAGVTVHAARSAENLKKIAVGWMKEREGSWVVLCSGEAQRDRVGRWLDVAVPRIGRRLHLLDCDQVGTLLEAKSTVTNRKVPMKGSLAGDEDYRMRIDVGSRVLSVLRSEHVVELCDVASTSRWIGPVVDSVLFVTDDSTSLSEIAGALKYAAKDFSIALARDDHLMTLSVTRELRATHADVIFSEQ